MVKIQADDVLTTTPYFIVGLVLALICLMISIFTIWQLKAKTEFKKTYFYYSMMLIVAGSFITSILYFSNVICDTRSLRENYCPNWINVYINVLMWEITYLMFFALLVGASFKYTVIKTLNRWKYDLQPPIMIVGLFFYLATSVTRIAYATPLITDTLSIVFLVTSYILYTVMIDVSFLIILLRKLRETRKVCVVIPKHLESAYKSNKSSLIAFIVMFPTLFILVILTRALHLEDGETRDNVSNLLKYLLHLAAIIYFSLNVFSMVLIKKLAEVEDCSSSYFGLDSTVVNDSKLIRSAP